MRTDSLSDRRTGALILRIAIEKFPLKESFHITGYTLVDIDVVMVTLESDGHTGRGEASGVYYRKDDDAPGMARQIETVRPQIEVGIDRGSLQRLLPAGGAGNAVDCALWDLEAKQTDQAAWQIAGLDRPRSLLTTFTVGAGDPEKMAADARAYGHAKALKLKLTGQPVDADRVCAVRAARPDVWLGVDANQGFTRSLLDQLLPVLVQARVQLIEQPFAAGQEAQLKGLNSPIAIAADESAQGLGDLPGLVGRYDVVNIKLDKCGGLTEGLAMARTARQLGLDVMVGNMVGTSLAMAPAFVVGQLCSVVDLDGPVLLSRDRSPSVHYENGRISCPEELWGHRNGAPGGHRARPRFGGHGI
ncbi:MAG: dipeptide epimerase [Steroidobacteraceae bacterium]